LEQDWLLPHIFWFQAKKLPPQSKMYNLMNLFGAVGIGMNVFVQRAYPPVVLQVVWAVIAIYGLYKSSKF
jgi:hypothetical protein